MDTSTNSAHSFTEGCDVPTTERMKGEPLKWRHYEINGKTIDLSENDRKILRYMAIGMDNKTISHSMGLTMNTVETYRFKICRKLQAANACHAVAIALRMKIID